MKHYYAASTGVFVPSVAEASIAALTKMGELAQKRHPGPESRKFCPKCGGSLIKPKEDRDGCHCPKGSK